MQSAANGVALDAHERTHVITLSKRRVFQRYRRDFPPVEEFVHDN